MLYSLKYLENSSSSWVLAFRCIWPVMHAQNIKYKTKKIYLYILFYNYVCALEHIYNCRKEYREIGLSSVPKTVVEDPDYQRWGAQGWGAWEKEGEPQPAPPSPVPLAAACLLCCTCPGAGNTSACPAWQGYGELLHYHRAARCHCDLTVTVPCVLQDRYESLNLVLS